jgi:hypothetical protein
MALTSAIPALLVTVGGAVALELRRISDVQMAVAQQRSADALARAASRGPNAS